MQCLEIGYSTPANFLYALDAAGYRKHVTESMLLKWAYICATTSLHPCHCHNYTTSQNCLCNLSALCWADRKYSL